MLVVERFVHIAKPGRVDELEEFLVALDEHCAPLPSRIYRTHTGIRDAVIVEIEFESWEERERFWGDWAADPESDVFRGRLNELVAPGRTSQLLWRVV